MDAGLKPDIDVNKAAVFLYGSIINKRSSFGSSQNDRVVLQFSK